ncbi:MAG: methionyl-tRNA formyltransferase [Bacteroidetes bacterium]|nr:methionyl-tRNA formyltransferase [Bacteroidota bacterium]PHX82662.1 MAG: methionyl-tRNA formyltransferase [Flavobacteriales bacterium]
MESQQLRIIFMGTPIFAVATLKKLVKENYNIVAVVTSPDKPAGRGQQVQESEVKQFASQHNIPVLQPEKLKSQEFIEQLKLLNPDLQIVVAFRMLPEVVWQLPKYGTFNLHASMLPQYRGAAPINHAIINGENQTGVSTFFLEQDIDTGKIIFQEAIPIEPDEVAGELHDRMMEIGANLVVRTVAAIGKGEISKISQADFIKKGEVLKTAPKIFRANCKINWDLDGMAIHNHIRGLSPYPAAWTELHRENGEVIALKIHKSKFTPSIANDKEFKAGSIIEHFKIYTLTGILEVLEVQAAGKKKIKASEFLLGFKFKDGDLFK